MTDKKPTAATEPETGAAEQDSEEKRGKTFWAGVGIGSAALVAALMYASKRPKRRGK